MEWCADRMRSRSRAAVNPSQTIEFTMSRESNGPPGRSRRQCVPGMAVGAGGALTLGVNRLPPVGLIDFSVGVTEEEVVAGVVDSGAFSPPPHAAVRPIIATIAVPPTAAATRRTRRCDLMC
jgi:hypothetical protein